MGKPVYPHGVAPEDLNREVQAWIEAQMREIGSGHESRILQKRRTR